MAKNWTKFAAIFPPLKNYSRDESSRAGENSLINGTFGKLTHPPVMGDRKWASETKSQLFFGEEKGRQIWSGSKGAGTKKSSSWNKSWHSGTLGSWVGEGLHSMGTLGARANMSNYCGRGLAGQQNKQRWNEVNPPWDNDDGKAASTKKTQWLVTLLYKCNWSCQARLGTRQTNFTLFSCPLFVH